MINPKRMKKVKKMRRIRKWKLRSLVVLCSMIFFILLLLTFIYTSVGIKIISTVLQKTVPEIHINHVSGSLNNLTMEGFSLNMPGIGVSVGEAQLSLSGLCLLEGKICVKNFQAKDVTVNIDTDKIPTSETKVVETDSSKRFILKTPLPIELKSATLTDVNVDVNKMHFGLTTFQGSATWINQLIYVSPTTAMNVEAIFADDGQQPVTKTDKSNLAINQIIDAIFNEPLIRSLPNVNIPLDFYVNHLTGDGWLLHIGGEDYRFDHVIIDANTVNNLIQAKIVETDAKSTYGNTHLKVNGQIKLGDKWPINANIYGKTDPITKQRVTELNGQFDGQLLGTLSVKLNLNGLNQADIFAKVNFIEKYLPLTAKLSGRHLQWPLVDKAEYQLNNFNADLSGLVNRYSLNAKGDVINQSVSSAYFEIQSKGTNENIDINHAIVALPQGELVLSGKIDWVNKLLWNTSVNFKNLDLTQWLPDYPIKLDGKLLTNGSYNANYWSISLNDVDLDGDINHAPLQVSGNLLINSDQDFTAQNFNISWGRNQIKINGAMDQKCLIAEVNLANLNVIDQKLTGDITGHFIVNGSLKKPTITSNLMINKLVWNDLMVDKATLNGKVTYNNMLAGDINFNIKQFQMANLVADNANISLSGNEKNHQIKFAIVGKPLSSQFQLNGSLINDRNEWQAVVPQAIWSLDQNNDWRVNHPLKINYNFSKNIGKFNAHCWLNKQSSICLDNDVSIANGGLIKISLNNIDLEQIDPFINTQTNIAGYVNGKAAIKWNAKSKIPSILASLESNDVYIKQQISSQTLPIPFDRFNINANLDDDHANLDWQFGIKNLGEFKGKLQVANPMTDKRLSGQVVIDNLSLAIINPLLNDNEHANGFINSNLKFSGSLGDPYIMGNFDVEHSEIKANQLPVDIRSIMIDIDFLGKSSVLNGNMKTQAGVVNITGKANWQNLDNWNANVAVKGAAINVNMSPLLTMQLIPNIQMKANQQLLELDGQINIPKANIQVESLPPSIVDVSSDEVILDNNLQPVQSQNYGIALNSHVLVSLGDDVTIDAYGLAANLTGKLFVTQSTKGTTVNGQINIPNGRFHAYGQDLVVNKGEIIFAGLPEQPRLNIEAIRNQDAIEDNVTAGIRITGLANDPKVEIFSNPAMSQQEALSYLLRGQGLNSDEQNDNDMFTALLIGLGTAQTGSLVGNIGDRFGIKNLSLDTQGVGNTQKVVVSGYILPNLQLKYGVGIFDSLAIFTLRYRLLPRLYLDVASGLDQTVDLIYQFDF